MMQRLALTFSATALAVALLGLTPFGQAARSAIEKAVPYANVAGFAKNAGHVNGHASSAKPKAGQIPVLNTRGKLPLSIGAVGAAGPKGDPGPQGAPGLSGYQQIVQQITVASGSENSNYDVSCPGGKYVLAGGYNLTKGDSDLEVFESQPASNSVWRFRIRNPTGEKRSGQTLYAVCANVGS